MQFSSPQKVFYSSLIFVMMKYINNKNNFTTVTGNNIEMNEQGIHYTATVSILTATVRSVDS